MGLVDLLENRQVDLMGDLEVLHVGLVDTPEVWPLEDLDILQVDPLDLLVERIQDILVEHLEKLEGPLDTQQVGLPEGRNQDILQAGLPEHQVHLDIQLEVHPEEVLQPDTRPEGLLEERHLDIRQEDLLGPLVVELPLDILLEDPLEALNLDTRTLGEIESREGKEHLLGVEHQAGTDPGRGRADHHRMEQVPHHDKAEAYVDPGRMLRPEEELMLRIQEEKESFEE